MDVEELSGVIGDAIEDADLDGLSITGGEPSEQAEAVAALVESVRLHSRSARRCRSVDVLVFSGLTFRQMKQQAAALVKVSDAIACGPYQRERPRAGRLIASDNQELVILNEDVRPAFEAYAQDGCKALQFDLARSGVSFVGMPEADDLSKLEEKLAKRGIVLGGVSWRS